MYLGENGPSYNRVKLYLEIDGLEQDCSISSALAMDIPQPCTKPAKWLQSISDAPSVWVRGRGGTGTALLSAWFSKLSEEQTPGDLDPGDGGAMVITDGRGTWNV